MFKIYKLPLKKTPQKTGCFKKMDLIWTLTDNFYNFNIVKPIAPMQMYIQQITVH